MTAKLIAATLSLVLTLAAIEVGLRARGVRAWENLPYPSMPLMHEPDPELGWRPIPGEYVFGEEDTIRMTFWPGGLRATAPRRAPKSRPIVLVGDSFMQGWAVSDADTAGYRLQEAFPSTEIVNIGTGGYGTYQSLLRLERYLRETHVSPSLVIYGFNVFHEARNVAASFWLRILSSLSQLGTVEVPYGTVAADGTLERHPPIGYRPWPLARRFATVAFLQARYANLAGAERLAQSTEVTGLVLLEMNRVARAAGADFFVVLFENLGSSKRHYEELFRDAGIPFENCVPKTREERAVTKYAHPGALANRYWARCIESALRRDLPGRVAQIEAGDDGEDDGIVRDRKRVAPGG